MKPDINTLKQLYVTERLSMQQIADRCNVRHASTVGKWLISYGINSLPTSTLARYVDSASRNRPDIETVIRLYETERMTTRQVGDMFGVSKTQVLRWLKFYGISPRDAHNGLLNRGIQGPTKDELEHLVHVEHHSYDEIAAMYGVDPTAVPFWLKKHQIRRPTTWETRRKGMQPVYPTQDELHHMYIEQGMTLAQIAAIHNVSQTPIARLCSEFEIPLRPDGFNGGVRFLCEDGHHVRSTYEQKVDNWLHEHGITHEYEPQLPFDKRYHADFLVNGWYIEIWGVTASKDYSQRKARKISMYHAHQIPLIQLSVDSFSTRRKNSWQKRLMRCLSEHPQS